MAEVRRYQTGKHLEAFILLLVREQPDHGGAIIARLTALLPDVWTVDPGRVYHMLRDLQAEGALRSEWVVGAAGAPVRLYHVTVAGDERLDGWRDDMAVRRDSLNTFFALWERVMRIAPPPG